MNRIKNQLQQLKEIGIWYSLAYLSPYSLKKANYGSCGFAIGLILFGTGAAFQGDRNASYTPVRLSRNYDLYLLERGDYLSCQCLGCKYASGNYLLPCAVNPSLEKDEDCNYFEVKSENTSVVDELEE
jgi:hypothetical protein